MKTERTKDLSITVQCWAAMAGSHIHGDFSQRPDKYLLTGDTNTYHNVQGQLWCPLNLTQLRQGPGKEGTEGQAGSPKSVHLIPYGRESINNEKQTEGNGPATNEATFFSLKPDNIFKLWVGNLG